MNRSEVEKHDYRVGDHRQIEAEWDRRLPKLIQNPPYGVPIYANIRLTTHCFYVDLALFKTSFKTTGPFQTLAREVKSAHRITRRATDGDHPSLVCAPWVPEGSDGSGLISRAQIMKTIDVRSHSISSSTL